MARDLVVWQRGPRLALGSHRSRDRARRVRARGASDRGGPRGGERVTGPPHGPPPGLLLEAHIKIVTLAPYCLSALLMSPTPRPNLAARRQVHARGAGVGRLPLPRHDRARWQPLPPGLRPLRPARHRVRLAALTPWTPCPGCASRPMGWKVRAKRPGLTVRTACAGIASGGSGTSAQARRARTCSAPHTHAPSKCCARRSRQATNS